MARISSSCPIIPELGQIFKKDDGMVSAKEVLRHIRWICASSDTEAATQLLSRVITGILEDVPLIDEDLWMELCMPTETRSNSHSYTPSELSQSSRSIMRGPGERCASKKPSSNSFDRPIVPQQPEQLAEQEAAPVNQNESRSRSRVLTSWFRAARLAGGRRSSSSPKSASTNANPVRPSGRDIRGYYDFWLGSVADSANQQPERNSLRGGFDSIADKPSPRTAFA
eukprot:TRINITY_DN69805_c0_g1_i1.p1 TRINITY_DN69805_c0_g1~~TRINITY_DN69805_c0_g1_i1.p1  ORF type:complete len:226 (-),score=38.48 TRINITY_DN69805_c0_g1_i1:194-871(-)